MSLSPPLTHHQILELVTPFTRGGHRIDMAASDRAARSLVFKPVERDGWRVQLRLQALEADTERWRLSRSVCWLGAPELGMGAVSLPEGAQPEPAVALLQAEGDSPAALLARVDTIALQAQCSVGEGHVICHTQQLLPPLPAGTPDVPAQRLALTQALVLLPLGYRLGLRVPRVKGISAELSWQREGGAGVVPPPDLLSVLGMPWSRLDAHQGGWRASLRLRGEGLVRSRDAQAKLAQAAVHLTQTLSQPPTAFHPRFRRQRWAATLRRAVPLAVCVGLVGASASVPWLKLGEDSAVRMLIFNSPPILLGLFFCLPEMPRFEIPPRPRPLTASQWTLPSP